MGQTEWAWGVGDAQASHVLRRPEPALPGASNLELVWVASKGTVYHLHN